MSHPPGQPTISGSGCLTEQASELVDDYLRPHVRAFTSYAQDTMDLLKALEGIFIPEGEWLVDVDVEALYDSVLHKLEGGIQIMVCFISELCISAGPYNQFILDLL